MSRATLALVAFFLVRLAPGILSADEPMEKVKLQVVVTTSDDEQISGAIEGLAEGKLLLATDPPRAIPLADVERIEFGKTLATRGELIWVGQDNHDLVQVGGAVGGNGIQDLHLRITTLKPLALKQITATCRFPNQLRVWRLDTSQSPHWRLAIARAELTPEADLYLEPPSADSLGLEFELTFTYSDGSTAKASVKAGTSTSDQLKVDRATQPGENQDKAAAPAPGKSEVTLIEANRLRGEVIAMTSETLTLRATWKADIEIPILRVRGVWLGAAAPEGARADFDKQMTAAGDEDVVFLLAADKAATQIQGSVRGLADGKLSVRFQGEDRAVKQERVLGIVFAAHPKIPAETDPFQVFVLSSGDAIWGRWLGLTGDALEIETLWRARLQLPQSQLAEIRARNGRLTYLSDLEPSAVEETPYFGRVIHWRRDQGFEDGPAKVKGKEAARSLAMHSRSALTYELAEQYEKFKAVVGFDDSSANRGRVACRVLADGREVFSQKDLRADGEPMAVEVPLTGAKQLTLEVDFGEAEDVGDRVIWAEPRLFRAEKK